MDRMMAGGFLQLTWTHFDRAVLQLVALCPNASSIFGIPRGGLPLAVSISHRTGIPIVMRPRPGSVLVDDIADSGSTIEAYRSLVQPAAVLTWFRRTTCTAIGVNSLHDVDPGTWVVFPWELETRAKAEAAEYASRQRSFSVNPG